MAKKSQGKTLTPQEEKRIDDMFQKIQEVDARVTKVEQAQRDLMTTGVIKSGQTRRKTGRKKDVQSRVSRIAELIEKGCV